MTTNIRASNKSGRPAVTLCISGSNVFRITKITAPVTIAILYRGGSNAGAVLPKIGINQNSRPVCFAILGSSSTVFPSFPILPDFGSCRSGQLRYTQDLLDRVVGLCSHPYAQLKGYLSFLLRDLFDEIPQQIKSSGGSEKFVYKITEKGIRLMQISKEIESLVGLD
jgi:hypothetical protein